MKGGTSARIAYIEFIAKKDWVCGVSGLGVTPSAVHRERRTPAGFGNDVWSMDFVHDQLSDGRRFRTLTVIDVFTRECLEMALVHLQESLSARFLMSALLRESDRPFVFEGPSAATARSAEQKLPLANAMCELNARDRDRGALE